MKVSLSSGPKSVEVPNVTGMTQDQAREALAAKGLTVGSVQVSDDPSQKEGLVISTNPVAGTSVDKDTAVTLTVSSDKITIPSGLVGYERASVVQILQELGLRASVTEQYSNDLGAGGVLAVNPTEGSVVAQGSTVNLTVSKGPQTAPANPNSSGQANSGS